LLNKIWLNERKAPVCRIDGQENSREVASFNEQK